MTDDAAPATDADDAGTRGDDATETRPTKDAGPDDGESRDGAERMAEGDANEDKEGLLARIGTVVAWLVGVALIAVGLLGMSGGGPGLVPLVLGLFVTPRTRRELKELCRMWCG